LVLRLVISRDMDNLQEITQQLAEIRATLAQNSIRPIVEDEEAVVYQQPATAEEFAIHVKSDVKNLPVFTGEGHPSLNDWLTDVAPLIENMDRLIPNTYDYHYFLREIKRKIQGPAGTMLSNYGVQLKWSSIKRALVNHFSDKRSLSVLEIQALTLRQGKNTLEFFYKQANELLTKTIEAIRLSPDIEEQSTHSHMKIARKRILSCFVNGLDPLMEAHCRAMKPRGLDEAFNLCIELRNANKLKKMLDHPHIDSAKKNQNEAKRSPANQQGPPYQKHLSRERINQTSK
jgi:hypothetical protein